MFEKVRIFDGGSEGDIVRKVMCVGSNVPLLDRDL